MIQPDNRHMSMSLYLTVLAVAETIILILGGFFECVYVKVSYLWPEYIQFLFSCGGGTILGGTF